MKRRRTQPRMRALRVVFLRRIHAGETWYVVQVGRPTGDRSVEIAGNIVLRKKGLTLAVTGTVFTGRPGPDVHFRGTGLQGYARAASWFNAQLTRIRGERMLRMPTVEQILFAPEDVASMGPTHAIPGLPGWFLDPCPSTGVSIVQFSRTQGQLSQRTLPKQEVQMRFARARGR